MASRKRLEGTLADWYPHPKEAAPSLAPVVTDAEAREAEAHDAPPPVVPDSPPAMTPSFAPVVTDAAHAAPPDSSPFLPLPLPSETSAQPETAPAPVPAHAADDDDFGHAFFAGPVAVEEPHPHAVAFDTDIDLRTLRPRRPPETAAARARRRYLARYVTAVVALAGAIGLGAVARVATAPVDDFKPQAAAMIPVMTIAADPPAPAPVDPAPAADPTPPAAETAAAAAPAAETAAAVAAPEVAPAGETAKDQAQPHDETAAAAESNEDEDEAPREEAAPAPAKVAEETAKPAETRPHAQTAAQAKEEARRDLERGRLRKAIAAGKTAVALDPTDAESWLVLGAAYQQRGAFKAARRTFTNCIRKAQHGPRGECAALLR